MVVVQTADRCLGGGMQQLLYMHARRTVDAFLSGPSFFVAYVKFMGYRTEIDSASCLPQLVALVSHWTPLAATGFLHAASSATSTL